MRKQYDRNKMKSLLVLVCMLKVRGSLKCINKIKLFIVLHFNIKGGLYRSISNMCVYPASEINWITIVASSNHSQLKDKNVLQQLRV